eukprot:c6477_g1_i3.p3 GENE.c6477_g1_i3~~c6477_g1_i3.p3  ORF type:complete len:110 (-),score=23.53 c6477_g1_i3:606-935(-)
MKKFFVFASNLYVCADRSLLATLLAGLVLTKPNMQRHNHIRNVQIACVGTAITHTIARTHPSTHLQTQHFSKTLSALLGSWVVWSIPSTTSLLCAVSTARSVFRSTHCP